MGNKSPKNREEKKKKKETSTSVSSSTIKTVVSQPELIRKPKKGL